MWVGYVMRGDPLKLPLLSGTVTMWVGYVMRGDPLKGYHH
jgi:hypothetical protein